MPRELLSRVGSNMVVMFMPGAQYFDVLKRKPLGHQLLCREQCSQQMPPPTPELPPLGWVGGASQLSVVLGSKTPAHTHSHARTCAPATTLRRAVLRGKP